MELDLPLYAVQRLPNGQWLVRTLMGDPIMPAVDVVVVLDEPTRAAPRPTLAARPLAGAQVPLARLWQRS
jgi:hypothetical protein